jgi:hypothetical protein
MEEDMKKIQDGNNENVFVTPLAAFHPATGMVDVLQQEVQIGEGERNGSIKEIMTDMIHDKSDGSFVKGELSPDVMTSVNEGISQEDMSDIIKETQGQLTPKDSQFVVHGRDGSYLMDKSKWTKLDLPSEKILQDNEGVEGFTQEDSLVFHLPNLGGVDSQHILSMGKDTDDVSQVVGSMESFCGEDLMDNASIMSKDSDGGGDGQGWQAPKSKKTRKSKKMVVATRTSSRVLRDGVPIATKAAQRAMAKNNITGTS